MFMHVGQGRIASYPLPQNHAHEEGNS